MAKNETGITDTGERADPLNRKMRRTTSGWATDTGAAVADGTFRSDGTRRGLNVIGRTAKRRGSR